MYEEHLIGLVPEGDELGDRLHALVTERPGYALGVSSAQPPRATAEAYDQARHALAMARNAPDRVAGYRGQGPLERLLPRETARAWARSFLGPLGAVPAGTVGVTRLALSFPRAGVARLLGISRNTVTARVGDVERALGLDLRDVGARAALALALAVGSPPPAAASRGRRAPRSTSCRGPRRRGRGPRRCSPRCGSPSTTSCAPPCGPGSTPTWTRGTPRTASGSAGTGAGAAQDGRTAAGRDLLGTGAGIHDLVHALRATGAP
ncbi:helix-turn-helix domain-containing protein [Streptomyces sp. 8K308]|uniref:helix-turn-helix domain-containing protein n=1 Tax=Streptomyces sp. 8K308 TaxID=2530388 RepID=UPI001405542F|nr:helix-turn-helix domain-containing protein [Streptomyces sp. 8K308]